MSFLKDLAERIDNVEAAVSLSTIGKILSVKDGIAFANGLENVGYNEIVEIELASGEAILAVAFNLEYDKTGLLILEDYSEITEGLKVRSTGKILSIKVDDSIISRVVSPIGTPLDDKISAFSENSVEMPLEKVAPGVMTRYPVTRPLQTGILVVDALVNVGRGQRELIIGDRQTGKTSLAIDTIINQKGQDIICIYVAIGQKQSKTKQIIQKLKQTGAMDYTVIVNASASDPVALQYLAPYGGVAIAEYFMQKGKDVLVIYDDLTKHAWAYRQLSLLFRRPPGREAYPGDVFYLHSRLLERACQLDEKNGGGSITALPIIETQAGDISAYIPTNVISITDGQIFLESELFNSGIRPAVNAGVSVTRVGGAAQAKNLKKVSGSLKLELAQYRELAAFAKFGGDLDKETQQRLKHGQSLTQLLVQPPSKPYSLAQEVILIYAANQGYIDSYTKEEIQSWIVDILEFLDKFFGDLVNKLDKKFWDAETEAELKKAVSDFQETRK